MKINIEKTLYTIDSTNNFDKQLKKVFNQNKDIEKLLRILEKLANK